MTLSKKFFLNSPYFLKRVLVNLEALKRNYYRRWGNYKNLYSELKPNELFPKEYGKIQDDLIKSLSNYVNGNIPAYEKMNGIDSIIMLYKYPLLNKDMYIKDIKSYIDLQYPVSKYYKGKTSGSTGKPLVFYRDREAVRYNYLLADKALELIGLHKDDVKCRFSGVSIFNFEKQTPPFWIYVDVFKQLQCSSYHLNESNFKLYIDAMKNHNVSFGTGYANTWLHLAEYVLKHSYNKLTLKAIVTDSEGITDEQQNLIEKAFNCKVHQTYGLGEVGQIAIQCSKRNYHILPQAAYVEIIDEKGENISTERTGEITVTSLYAKKTPFIRYQTGDLGVISNNQCDCGWHGQVLLNIIGRVDDYIITESGAKITRLSHLIKPVKGVVNSQIIQSDKNSLAINLIVNENFERNSMERAIKEAKSYVGNMSIEWNIVEYLEKTKSGKIRHVIRRF
jgi:phenylacetate-CoA ligase